MRKEKVNSVAVVGGEGISISGNIEASVDMMIRSNVVGDITSEASVTVEGYAVIRGNITAVNLVITAGEIFGNINAKSVKLGSDAVVSGDINTSVIEIDEGAMFNGTCNTKFSGETCLIKEDTR